jgi:hypothetical protein
MSSQLLLDLPTGLFNSGFPTKNMQAFPISFVHSTRSDNLTHSPWIDNTNIFWTSTDYEVHHETIFTFCCYFLCSLYYVSSVLRSNITAVVANFTQWRPKNLAKMPSRPFCNFMCIKNNPFQFSAFKTTDILVILTKNLQISWNFQDYDHFNFTV